MKIEEDARSFLLVGVWIRVGPCPESRRRNPDGLGAPCLASFARRGDFDLNAGCPTLVAFFATEPALSEVEGVGILTWDGDSPVTVCPQCEAYRGTSTGAPCLAFFARRADFDLMQTSECNKSRHREASQDQRPLPSPATFISRSITLRSALLIRVW